MGERVDKTRTDIWTGKKDDLSWPWESPGANVIKLFTAVIYKFL